MLEESLEDAKSVQRESDERGDEIEKERQRREIDRLGAEARTAALWRLISLQSHRSGRSGDTGWVQYR